MHCAPHRPHTWWAWATLPDADTRAEGGAAKTIPAAAFPPLPPKKTLFGVSCFSFLLKSTPGTRRTFAVSEHAATNFALPFSVTSTSQCVDGWLVLIACAVSSKGRRPNTSQTHTVTGTIYPHAVVCAGKFAPGPAPASAAGLHDSSLSIHTLAPQFLLSHQMPRSLPANNIGQGKRRKRLC